MKKQRHEVREDGKLLTVKQAAEVLHVPAPTLYRWIGQKLIPSLELGPTGRTKRIPRAALDAILARTASSGNVETTLRGKRWFTPTTLKTRVAPAGSDEEIMVTTDTWPRIPVTAVQRLSKLEKQYHVDSAQVVLATHRGDIPQGVPKKVAQEWSALFARATPRGQ